MDAPLETTTHMPVLNLQAISKSFPGVQALLDVDLEVHSGEIHGLVGKNGAGKSTLVRVLMGLHPPDSGKIEIGERTYSSVTSDEALGAGIAYVPQHVEMMDSLTVAENILAGDMPKSRSGLISWKAVNQEADQRLKKLGLDLNVHARVEGLSVAEQTMLAIAKALFGNARVMILDEPTASLPRADINRLFGFIRSLKDKGVAFIYISHHLEEVFEICDRVTVLRDGLRVGTYEVSDLDLSGLTHLIVGEEIQEYTREPAIQEGVVLELRNLTRRGYYEGINLTISRGEVVGISGLQGSGAETLAMGLFGLEGWGIGEVTINGKPFTARTPKQALDQGLAYLPQDRYRYGLIGLRPVRENVTYTVLDRLTSTLMHFVNLPRERKLVDEYIDGLGIVTPSQEQMTRLLSGGNQQKVVFAKLAAAKPSVLLLHEPTQGIDVRAKQDIFRIIDELSQQGVAVLIVSSEVREMIGVCDRILVMYAGRLIREFKRGEAETTPQNILQVIEGGNNHGER
jgi:ABC-type sugar transport system ATPase subunit